MVMESVDKRGSARGVVRKMARYWIALFIACMVLGAAFARSLFAAPAGSITIELPPAAPAIPAPGFHFSKAG